MAVVAIAAGFYLRNRQPGATPSAANPAAATPSSGLTLSLPGTIEAAEVVAIPVPFDGKIESLRANVGQEVSEGDLLAEIRSSDLLSQRELVTTELNRLSSRVSTLESNLIAARLEAVRARESSGAAKAALEEAQKGLSRQQMLYSKGAAARQALERSQAAVDSATEVYEGYQQVAKMADSRVAELTKDLEAQQQAQAEKSKELEGASDQVASGDIRSPVSGYVVARKGQLGEDVTIETEDLFQIAVNIAQLKVVLTPPPGELGKIYPGQDVILQIAELPESIEAKVNEVRDGQVSIEFTSPSAVLKPGMSAQVVFRMK